LLQQPSVQKPHQVALDGAFVWSEHFEVLRQIIPVLNLLCQVQIQTLDPKSSKLWQQKSPHNLTDYVGFSAFKLN
jgi:hypothetical protein